MDVKKEILSLHKWIKNNKYCYYSINSIPKVPFITSLVNNNRIIGVIWRQLFRLLPINFRPILNKGFSEKNPKAMILLALSYLELWCCLHELEFKKSFEYCIKIIISYKSQDHKNFAVPVLNDYYVKENNIKEDDISPLFTVWAGFLFLKAYNAFENTYYLELAKSVGKYFIEEHPKTTNGKYIYFYYAPNLSKKIYNASALVSSYLITLSRISCNQIYFEYGKKGIEYILRVQNKDGSWFYGEMKSTKYVDNFHTVFILFALYNAMQYWGNKDLTKRFNSGLKYYLENLCKKRNKKLYRPIHFDPRFLPSNSNIIQKVDIRDCALSIMLFSVLSKNDRKYLEYSKDIYDWTIKNMKGKETFFTEITWLWRNKIPYIEFQAWILLSFSKYLKYLLIREK